MEGGVLDKKRDVLQTRQLPHIQPGYGCVYSEGEKKGVLKWEIKVVTKE